MLGLHPPNCDCRCAPDEGCEDEPRYGCPLPQRVGDWFHFNDSGNVADYSATVKQWGGPTITSHALQNKPTGGYDGGCLTFDLEWSQPSPPGFFGQQVAPPGLGFEPLAGAWVVYEITGGPHVRLASRQSIKNVELSCNTRLTAKSPTVAASYVRIVGTVTGTWLVTVDGETTSPLGDSASVSDVAAALNALPGVNGVASVAGWPINTPSSGYQSVTVNNGCWYVIRWTDDVARTLTIDTSGLTGVTTSSAGETLATHHYRIVPVVFLNGAVYGPPYMKPVQAVTELEPCWKFKQSGTVCQDSQWLNQPLQPYYRTFSEHPAASPNSIQCEQYCRAEDFFGDWENATLERVRMHVAIAENKSYEWIPPTPRLDGVQDITFGFAIGFSSDVPGDYSATLLIDNLCLSCELEETPFCSVPADLIIDEPMDVAVPTSTGWRQTPMAQAGTANGWWGAQWRIDDGWLVTDEVQTGLFTTEPSSSYTGVLPWYWRERLYAGGSLWNDLGLPPGSPPPAAWRSTNFCLNVEAEFAPIQPDDVEWVAADQPGDPGNPTPEYDLNAHRPTQDCGLFIGGLAKFGIARNVEPGFDVVDGNYPGPNSAEGHSYRWDPCAASWFYLLLDSRIRQNGEIDSLGIETYECLNGYFPYGALEFETGDFDLITGTRAMPSEFSKLRLEVTHAGLHLIPGQIDCLANLRFYVKAYINDRPACWMTQTINSTSQNVSDVQGGNVWRYGPSIGIYAHRGCRVRKLKAWLKT